MNNEIKTIQGFVRWYDEKGDDGILTTFAGEEYYFDSWSFQKTRYRVTGKCKKTGRQKTIETRLYPGLWLNYTVIKDPLVLKLINGTAVSFVQADGMDQRWAVKIAVDSSIEARRAVWGYKLQCALDGMIETETDFRTSWYEYYEKRVESLLSEVWNEHKKAH
jgi:hypothetical protein